MIHVQIQQLPSAQGLDLPNYATAGAAGVDLLAACETEITLKPMEKMLAPTGLCIALPDGYEAQIRPRSGLAFKNGVTVLNSPGTIDADYRGELKILLINLGSESVTFKRGDRVAQMIIAPVSQVVWQPVTELSETARGQGGYGSTGIKSGTESSIETKIAS